METPKFIKITSEYVTLRGGQQEDNWKGQVFIANIQNKTIAVKIKSNNPSQYLVQPSSLFLSPLKHGVVSITRNNYKLQAATSDKFQFIATESSYDQSSSGKVDDSIFRNAKENSLQKIVLQILLEEEKKQFDPLEAVIQRNINDRNSIFTKGSPSHIEGESTQNGMLNNSQSENKPLFQKDLIAPGASSVRIQSSPQFFKGSAFGIAGLDKEKVYKAEYERLIQKVHEYEKNFQQLDQEIKSTNQEREKWNQIQNAHKITAKKQSRYETWHLLLVVLASMLIGVIWAK